MLHATVLLHPVRHATSDFAWPVMARAPDSMLPPAGLSMPPLAHQGFRQAGHDLPRPA